ncbi:SDR family NAD(P)-dependent oxidoreductase [Devosia sp.]|uniref:SDR family NAD(P)-dependent oxidoreductase n=1 Tax=Devosia sp. TaxID=1871048 RepID=UPI002F09BEB3
MEQRFKDRTAVVTGGANGIGRATVLRLLHEGASVIVLDKAGEESQPVQALRRESSAEQRLVYCQADVTSREQIMTALEHGTGRFGPADILVNNAGYGAPSKPIERVDRSEWDELIAVNLTSVFLVTQLVLPSMRARRFGRVVNLSSGAGRAPSPNLSLVYATAKAGLLGLTRKLAHEEAENGITVNAVAPGTIFTDRVRTRFEQNTPEQAASLHKIPMKRPGTAEEVASSILFLASDEASYITGTVTDINGGRYMG